MRPLGGVTYILSCTVVHSCPNCKLFELDTLRMHMKWPIFCLTVASPKLNFLGSF
eukprot:UN20660